MNKLTILFLVLVYTALVLIGGYYLAVWGMALIEQLFAG